MIENIFTIWKNGLVERLYLLEDEAAYFMLLYLEVHLEKFVLFEPQEMRKLIALVESREDGV